MRTLFSCCRLVLVGFVALLATGCAIDDLSGQNDEVVEAEELASVESEIEGLASCWGPSSMTGYYSGGRWYTNPVTVSCSSTVSRIRVWGELRINGTLRDTKDVTCWSSSSCTMPSMSASASQSDRWTSQYWFNWTN